MPIVSTAFLEDRQVSTYSDLSLYNSFYRSFLQPLQEPGQSIQPIDPFVLRTVHILHVQQQLRHVLVCTTRILFCLRLLQTLHQQLRISATIEQEYVFFPNVRNSGFLLLHSPESSIREYHRCIRFRHHRFRFLESLFHSPRSFLSDLRVRYLYQSQ